MAKKKLMRKKKVVRKDVEEVDNAEEEATDAVVKAKKKKKLSKKKTKSVAKPAEEKSTAKKKKKAATPKLVVEGKSPFRPDSAREKAFMICKKYKSIDKAKDALEAAGIDKGFAKYMSDNCPELMKFSA